MEVQSKDVSKGKREKGRFIFQLQLGKINLPILFFMTQNRDLGMYKAENFIKDNPSN